MPEYRQDPLTGRTVLVAEERASRPHQFDIENDDSPDASLSSRCPFCEGNEHFTPGEIEAFRPNGSAPDTPGWTVRVVPNKFPAVVRDDREFPDCLSFLRRFETPPSIGRLVHVLGEADLFPVPGVGNHEVLVDAPRHVLSVSDMTDEETVNMFRMYRNRLSALRREGRWAYVQLFKNVGAAAGASLPHAHSQLIAMPFIPQSFCNTLRKAEEYRSETGTCFWCDMLEFERRHGDRVIEQTPHFLALCPFVSRFAAEVEIYPRCHESTLEKVDDESKLDELARLVRRTVLRLEQAVFWMKDNLAYNFVLHTAPFVSADGKAETDEADASFHWHLSILPSLARAAGFEWGTGLHINPVPPEKAAARLREIHPENDPRIR